MTQAGLPRRPEGYDNLGVTLGSYTAGVHASAEYLEDLPAAGPGRLAGDPLQQHRRQRPGLGVRARARPARPERDRDPQGSLRAGRDRVRGAAGPARPVAGRARRRRRRPRAGLLPGARPVRGDGPRRRAVPALRRRPQRLPDGRGRVPVRARGRSAGAQPRRPHPRLRHRDRVGGVAGRLQCLARRSGRTGPGHARRHRAGRPHRRRHRRGLRRGQRQPGRSTRPRRRPSAASSAIARCRSSPSRGRWASPGPRAAPASRPRCCAPNGASRQPTVGLARRGPDTPAGARAEAQPIAGPRALVLSIGSGGTVVAVVIEGA